MDKLTLTTVHKQRIALGAFAVATIMLVDCIYQVAMHIRWQVWLPSTLVVEEPLTGSKPVPQPAADEQSADKQSADVEGKSSETRAGKGEGQSSETQPGDAEASDEKPTATEASAEKPADAEESLDRLGSRSHTETKSNGDKPETPKKAKMILAPLEAAIAKRNIMAKPKPKTVELIGVLGKIALLKTGTGKTVGIEEGKSAQGIKVISIEGYQVTIEHHGKTETKMLFPDKVGKRSSLPSDRGEASNASKGTNP